MLLDITNFYMICSRFMIL